ncbi:MAG TPA: PAS domain S-box protein [Stellaceae bacterium]|nr:PAS domain S-box protein [Stellaceae bacterium]
MIKNSAGQTTETIDPQPGARRLTLTERSVGLNGRDEKQASEFGDGRWHFRDLLDALPAAIYTTDAVGRITFFNQAAVEFSGRTPEIGSDQWCVTWRLYWPDGRPMAHDECPMARALKEDRPIRGGEAVAERPDGTRVPFMACPTPLHDASGRLVGAVNMLVDQTAVKEADEARRRLNETLERRVEERTRQLTETLTQLRESECRFRLFVGGVTDYAIFMLDTEGLITNWNAGAERIKGYRAEEIIGRHFSMFYSPKEREDGLPQRALMTAARDGRFEAEGWRIRKDGTRFWANVVIDAVHDDAGVLIGFAKVTRDMTERRAVEEQLRQSQKMEAVGQLTNGVAHDFNNLLATIIPYLELAQFHIEEERVLRYLENAMRAAERGAQLTNQLLAFSRRHELLTEPVDVNQVVSEACEMLPRTIGPTIEIETVLDRNAWWAMTEPGQLELAILNLALNARDAMLAGGKLTIATKNIGRGSGRSILPLDPGDYVRISVADTGTGMSEEVRSRAFEPFFTTKEINKGTGLGLSMVYGFAKQSDGTLTIDSEIGNGTTVRIYLPRAPYRSEGAEQEGGQGQCDAGPPSRILVVDDDSAVRAITGIMLRTLGHDAIEAAGGQDALNLLAHDRKFHLLIVDLAMPNMHGEEFAARARVLIPDVPLLFVTGYAERGRVRQRTAGEMLKKPFRRAQLAGKLRYILHAATRRNRRLPIGIEQR